MHEADLNTSLIATSEQVQGILSGHQRQLRLAMKPQPFRTTPGGLLAWRSKRSGLMFGSFEEGAPWKPGHLFYVREGWGMEFGSSQMGGDCATTDWERYVYRATEKRFTGPWRSPATMPKRAARLWLRLEDLRVERLQSVTETDALAEGILRPSAPCGTCQCLELGGWHTCGYSLLWDYKLPRSHTAGHRWGDNPWAWVLRFSREA